LTINWHDRSIAPERLWGDFYLDLLDELKRRNPWFPTAAQAVAWFQRRRAARFDIVRQDDGSVQTRACDYSAGAGVPGLTLRTHTSKGAEEGPLRAMRRTEYVDTPVATESADTRMAVSHP